MTFGDCGTTTGTGFVYWDQLVFFFLIQTSSENILILIQHSQFPHSAISLTWTTCLNCFLTCFHSPQWYLNSLIYHEHTPDHPTSAWIHGFILHNRNGLCEMTWVEWGCGARLSWPKCFFFFVFYVCVPRTVSPLLRRISWIFLKRIKMKKYYIV